jgi:putative SOS response-associated peptidase YedK
MCNDYRLEVDIASIAEDFENLKIKIRMPEGAPNVAAREDIKITEIAPIVKSVEGERGAGELVNRRWSWPGRKGQAVYNFRTEGFPGHPPPDLSVRRCLILADGFYEFTDPENPKQKRLDKWLFTMMDHRWFCIAGIWQHHPDVGEAFTMLTMEPGDDVRPFHDRQIIPLERDQWARWLDEDVPAGEVLRHLPAGRLIAERVYPPSGAGPRQASLSL